MENLEHQNNNTEQRKTWNLWVQHPSITMVLLTLAIYMKSHSFCDLHYCMDQFLAAMRALFLFDQLHKITDY